MTCKVRQSWSSGLWLPILLMMLGFANGCAKPAPEIKLDPALANKPFPKVESSAEKASAAPISFPKVGERKGP